MSSAVVMGGLGLVGGAFKYIIERYITVKHEQEMFKLNGMKQLRYDRNRASRIKDDGVSLTRRILVIMFSIGLLAPVILTIFNSDASVTVPQAYLEKGIWDYILPWKEGKEMVKYVTVKAPIIAMPIVDLLAMMIGYYFGDKGTRRII